MQVPGSTIDDRATYARLLMLLTEGARAARAARAYRVGDQWVLGCLRECYRMIRMIKANGKAAGMGPS